MNPTTHGRATPIGIAGAGRLARAIGCLLRDSRQPLASIASRTPARAQAAAEFIGAGIEAVTYADLAKHTQRILIAVPDDALEPVADTLVIDRGIVLHTCGARGAEALDRLRARGVSCGAIHPLQTIPEGSGAAPLAGIHFAVSGDDAAVQWAEQITTAAHGRILRVASESRPLYHAAAVMAGNYLVALLSAAEDLMDLAGVPRAQALEALAPLARASLENTLRRGPAGALTGPIERGDAATVARHLLALQEAAEPVRALYRAGGLQTLAIAAGRGLPPGRAADIERLLRAE
jgi:predicted short-subunit dehydrogenase-like oxidoreductase (DUF2520 family)